MPYSNSVDILTALKQEFTDINIQFKAIDYSGLISLFIVQPSTFEILADCWDQISGFIAAHYQVYLDNDFEKWNVYIMYITKFKVDQHLKYKIENDRFSSRKIVVDPFDKELNDLTIEDLIISHITNRDLEPQKVQKSKKANYVSDSSIWPLLRDTTLKNGKGKKAEADDLWKKIAKKLHK